MFTAIPYHFSIFSKIPPAPLMTDTKARYPLFSKNRPISLLHIRDIGSQSNTPGISWTFLRKNCKKFLRYTSTRPLIFINPLLLKETSSSNNTFKFCPMPLLSAHVLLGGGLLSQPAHWFDSRVSRKGVLLDLAPRSPAPSLVGL